MYSQVIFTSWVYFILTANFLPPSPFLPSFPPPSFILSFSPSFCVALTMTQLQLGSLGRIHWAEDRCPEALSGIGWSSWGEVGKQDWEVGLGCSLSRGHKQPYGKLLRGDQLRMCSHLGEGCGPLYPPTPRPIIRYRPPWKEVWPWAGCPSLAKAVLKRCKFWELSANSAPRRTGKCPSLLNRNLGQKLRGSVAEIGLLYLNMSCFVYLALSLFYSHL